MAACCAQGRFKAERQSVFPDVAASSGSIWRKNTRQSMEHLQRQAIPPKISGSFGSLIFPCSSGTRASKRWNAAHHPFTSLHDEDMAKLETSFDSIHDPKSPLGEIRALAYDVVLNGTELGSGSIRIHRQDIQSKIFRALGMTEEEARSRFGFFLEALEYGTPPHGGIALGLDRIVMILAGADSLREVIPFPKTARAVDLMVDAPTPVSEAQLRDLGIQVKKQI